MNKHSLTLLIFLFSLPFGYSQEKGAKKTKDEETIAVFDKKNVGDKAYDEIEKQEVNFKVGIDLWELKGLGFSGKADSKILKHKNVAHDIDKTYHDYVTNPQADTQWAKNILKVTFGVPLSLSFPNVLGPVGFNIIAHGKYSRDYHLTVRTDVPYLKKDPAFFKNLKNKLKVTAKGIGKVRIPLKPEKIVKYYYPGVEIVNRGEKSLLTGFGINVGVGIASVSANLYGMLKGTFKTKVKYLHSNSPKNKLFKLTISKEDSRGRTTEANARIGITLFETKHINGFLSVNLISAKTSKMKTKGAFYEYIYDISFPAASKALKSAMQGNLVPTEKLVFSRYRPDQYKGVLQLKSENSKLLQSIKQITWGLGLSNSNIKAMYTLQAKDSLAGLFHNYSGTTKTRVEKETSDFYEEKGRLYNKSFNYHKKKKYLFGLLADYEVDIKLDSSVIQTEIVNPEVGVIQNQMNKIVYNWKLTEKRKEDKAAKNFLQRASKVLGVNNEVLGDNIRNLSNHVGKRLTKDGPKFCSDNIKASIKGIFYQRAIDNILNRYSEKEYWAMLGRYLEFEVPAKLRYEKTRKKLVAQLKANRKKARRIIRGRISVRGGAILSYRRNPNVKKARVYKKKIDYALEWIKEFPSIIKEFKKAKEANRDASRYEIAEMFDESLKLRKEVADSFRGLFEGYKKELGLFEFLTTLAGMDYRSGSDDDRFSEGLFVKYKIKGEGCDFTWTQRGDIQFKLGDFNRN